MPVRGGLASDRVCARRVKGLQLRADESPVSSHRLPFFVRLSSHQDKEEEEGEERQSSSDRGWAAGGRVAKEEEEEDYLRTKKGEKDRIGCLLFVGGSVVR